MKLLDFPELRQTYIYDCGAEAMQSILVYYGSEISELAILKEAHTNKRNGTSIENIKNVIEKHKLQYDAKEMTVAEIKSYIDKKIPVILLVQAWHGRKVSYVNDFKDGHWVVAIGYESDKIIFEDPYSFTRTFLFESELIKRWHAKEDNKVLKHFGIAVYGKEPVYSLKQVKHMD